MTPLKKCLTYKDDVSDKFWSVELEENTLVIVYGRTGTDGVMNIKEFVTHAEAAVELEKLVAQKLKKGYQEVDLKAEKKREESQKAAMHEMRSKLLLDPHLIPAFVQEAVKNNDLDAIASEPKKALRQQLAKYYFLITGRSLLEDDYSFSLQELVDYKRIKLPRGNKLNLRHCKLSSLDGLQNIPGIAAVEELDLSHNPITFMRKDSFKGLINLKKLSINGDDVDIGGTPLESIAPGAFAGLDNLEVLSLHGCGLIKIQPGTFSGLSNLHCLVLSNNRLKTIKAGAFEGLENLEELNLSNNRLIALEREYFQDLKSLKKLTISNNAFSELSDRLSLRLNGNNIKVIKKGVFADLTTLRKLDLAGNYEVTFEQGAFDGLENLETLNIADCNQSSFPEELNGLKKLRYLDFSLNTVTTIDESTFDFLARLTRLCLSASAISLPPHLFKRLAALKALHVTKDIRMITSEVFANPQTD